MAELRTGEYAVKHVTVEGMRIRYTAVGAGPPLLLFHGYGEFLETWKLNIRALSEYRRVYAMDLPGHGLSDKPDVAYDVSFFTKFAAGFMQALGIDSASIMGHSFGGLISLSMAVYFPEKVDSLILESTTGLIEDVALMHRLCGVPILVDDLAESVMSLTEQRLKREFYNPGLVDKEIADKIYQFMRMPETKRVMLSILRHSVTASGMNPAVVMTDRLHLIKSPTLLIHGAQDEIVPLRLSQNACRVIPDARLKIFDECGHCPHIEKASEFNEAVTAFLKANEPGSSPQIG